MPENGPERGTIVQNVYNIEFWSIVDSEGFASVISESPVLFVKCKGTTIIKADGAFYITPQLGGVYQVLSFIADVGNKVRKYLNFALYYLLYSIPRWIYNTDPVLAQCRLPESKYWASILGQY